MTQVLCLSCSPRRGGNTDFCVEFLAEQLREEPGMQADVVRLDDYDIRHCLGCRRCMEINDCVIRDDGFHELWARIAAADVIVQASPVFWLGPPGRHKNLIDRSHAFFTCGRVLESKAGYTISVAGDSGFEPHEACIESWLAWYGVEVKDRVRIIAREAGDAAASASVRRTLKRFAEQITA